MKRYMDFGQILLKKGKDFSISSIINKTNKKRDQIHGFSCKICIFGHEKKNPLPRQALFIEPNSWKKQDLVDMGKKNNEQCLPYPNPFLNTQTKQSQHSL